jgi:hypothetical protein
VHPEKLVYRSRTSREQYRIVARVEALTAFYSWLAAAITSIDATPALLREALTPVTATEIEAAG